MKRKGKIKFSFSYLGSSVVVLSFFSIQPFLDFSLREFLFCVWYKKRLANERNVWFISWMAERKRKTKANIFLLPHIFLVSSILMMFGWRCWRIKIDSKIIRINWSKKKNIIILQFVEHKHDVWWTESQFRPTTATKFKIPREKSRKNISFVF